MIQVGSAVLHRMLGLSKNYKSFIPGTSHCKSCIAWKNLNSYEAVPSSQPFQQALKACSLCPYNSPSTQYINEKNRYGEECKMPKNAILLYIGLHFFNPDEKGIIKNILISDLMKKTGLSKRTLFANIERLVNAHLLAYAQGYYPDTLSFYLTEYSSYFMPAEQGGRGYISMDYKMFEEVKILDNINQLRITLKMLLNSFKDNSLKIESTYYDLKRFLPEYFKRFSINKMIDGLNAICSVQHNKRDITFIFKGAFNLKEARNKIEQECRTQITKSISSFNHAIVKMEKEAKKYPQISVPGFSNLKLQYYPQIHLSDSQLDTATFLALEYSPTPVLKALASYYSNYYITSTPVNNFGGLLRTLIREQFSSADIA